MSQLTYNAPYFNWQHISNIIYYFINKWTGCPAINIQKISTELVCNIEMWKYLINLPVTKYRPVEKIDNAIYKKCENINAKYPNYY